MAIEDAMALTNRLLAQAQSLSALTAHLRLKDTEASTDPALEDRIGRVVDLLGARDAVDALTDEERMVVVSFARSYMRQAVELMDDPTRANAWSHSDPKILQAQGAASAVVASLVKQAGLGRPGIRILDIGCGVAGLSIAFCRTFPDSTVVGIDPWEPAMTLARQNVAEAGLERRISLHLLPIESFEDRDGFDLVWFPSFFIPEPVVDAALRRVQGLMRPGGRVVMGVVEGPEDPLAAAVDAMITVRSGGAVLQPEEAGQRLRAAGFADVGEANRTWRAPLRLVLGRGD